MEEIEYIGVEIKDDIIKLLISKEIFGPNSKRLVDNFFFILHFNQCYNRVKTFCQIISANTNNFWNLGSQDSPLFALLPH